MSANSNESTFEGIIEDGLLTAGYIRAGLPLTNPGLFANSLSKMFILY